MMQLFQKKNGAVSVFLIIVLVPMLVLSAIFVDLSRVKLGKAVAASSADLTLNTALTRYDAVLKDMYGLFATSQDMDEMYENLEDYYRECIEAAGVDKVDANDYVGQIIDYIKTETGTDDMLQLELVDFTVDTNQAGSLANPAILKNQIVDFMKFRAPLDFAEGLFETISGMKELGKQTDLIDKKNTFYTKHHTDMLERLEKAWYHIEDYQYRDANVPDVLKSSWGPYTFPEGKYIEAAEEGLLGKEETGVVGAKDMVEDALLLSAAYVYYAKNFNNSVQNYMIAYNDLPESDEKHSGKWTVNNADTYYVDRANDKVIDELYGEDTTLEKKQELALKDLKESFNACFPLLHNVIQADDENTFFQTIRAGNANLSTSDKIYIVSISNEKIRSDYANNVRLLVGCLVTLANSLTYCEYLGVDLSTLYVKQESANKFVWTDDPNQAINVNFSNFCYDQIGHLNGFKNGDTNNAFFLYNDAMSRVRSYYNDTSGIVNSARTKIGDYLDTARDRADALYKFLDEKIKKLSEAISILNSIKSDLSNPESEYNKALTKWKNSAQSLSGNNMADSDAKEIERLQKVLSVDKVSKLITRLTGAKNSLTKLRSQVDSFSVMGVKWKDIPQSGGKVSYNALANKFTGADKEALDNVVKNYSTPVSKQLIGIVDPKFDPDLEPILESLNSRVIAAEPTYEWLGPPAEDGKSPDLKKDQIELYTWMYNNFCDTSAIQSKYNYRIPSNTKGGDLSQNQYGKSYTDSDGNAPEGKVSSHKNDADDTKNDSEAKAKEQNDKEAKEGTKVSRDWNNDILATLPSHTGVTSEGFTNNEDPDKNSSTAMLSSSSKSISSLDKVFELVKNFTATLRDDLYITDYIMNMFSYQTLEAEISVNHGESIGAFGSWYSESDGVYSYSSKFESFAQKAAMEKDALTLTNNPRDPNSCYLYGKEVEYIAFGGTNAVTKVYATIYAIRFAFNLIYAFTDAEITNITLAAATALFGVPPLTPLIPVAQIAMIIGLALAESAYDLYQLKSGQKIPLFKSTDTWVMKPSGAAKAVAGKIIEEVVDVAIDEGSKLLGDVIEMTDNELTKYINDNTDALKELSEDAVKNTIKELKDQANKAIQEAVRIVTEVEDEFKRDKDQIVNDVYNYGKTPEKIAKTIQELDTWLAEQQGRDSSYIYEAKKAAVDFMKENGGKVIGELFDEISKPVSDLANKTTEKIQEQGEKLNKLLDDIQEKINSKINELADTVNSEIGKLKDKMFNELKEAANKGAAELKGKLKEQIGATFGTNGGSVTAVAGQNSVLNSLLSWAYSDYLQLFVLASLAINEKNVLSRVADVIELNMQLITKNPGWMDVKETKKVKESRLWGLYHVTKTKEVTVTKRNEKGFHMDHAYTYIHINANMEAKPLMLTLPLIADTIKNEETGTSWYHIEYDSVGGY